MTLGVLEQRRDPWPSVQPAWCDPPWTMRGRAVTAWFDAPWEILEQTMSPDLLPQHAPTVRARLRFYDLSFEATDSTAQLLAPGAGRFHEAALAFPARAGDLDGELSSFLWTDSETYMIWGREAFGWPVRLAELELIGTLWGEEPLAGATGEAWFREEWGSAALLDVRITGPACHGTPSGVWLTPRRVLRRAGLDGERRELLVVRPLVREAGARYAATGRVRFDFTDPHPLQLLGELSAEVEVAVGFELLVGADVEIV